MPNMCQTNLLSEWPDELGAGVLYNPQFRLYCTVGWVLHCAGVPNRDLVGRMVTVHGRSATELAAELCGLSPKIWHSLMLQNDGLFNNCRARAQGMAIEVAQAIKDFEESQNG